MAHFAPHIAARNWSCIPPEYFDQLQDAWCIALRRQRTKRSRKTTIHSDDDAHTPTETAGTSGKKKGRGKKKTLAFEVEQAHDNDNIFEGRVKENVEDIDPNNDKDGSFSLEDTDREYEPFAIPGDLNREINMDDGLGLLTKNLADDGFIPLMGFQSNSAFNSLRNSPVNRKEPLPSDKSWRKGEQRSTDDTRLDTETPARPNTVDPEPPTNTETQTQPRPIVTPVKGDEPVPTPSTSGQAKPIVVSSDDDENASEYTRVRRQVRKLLNDETRVRSEVLTDLGAMTPTEVTIAKAFAYGQATKAFERLGMRDISSDTEEFIVEYNANLTTILIGRSFMAPDDEAERSKLRTNSFAEQKAALRRRIEKGKKKSTTRRLDEDIVIEKEGLPRQAENTRIDPKKGTGTKPKQPEVKIEMTGRKIPSLEEEEIRAIKEKVTLQRIRNSQLRDGMKPTVPDQGIIFDENNNPWLKPDFAESNTQTRQSSMGHKVHTRGGGPPDDGDGPDDEDDNNQGNGKRDPFTPRPWPRGTSMTPSSRSVESKTRDRERRYQKIIEFIRANLEKRLQIPDGLKPPRWDAKTMTKYGGLESKDVFWQ
ncbi:hypothetical protein ARMGADRAFT_1088599 [Armillaria gallica]|uniref:Uncharacterized protein n=1 Tax=Armillaria gallica TaxID=47427 RepID=A0A2H3CRV2_ARMGA|nr:hypothetical protein ARMGADRAFT_1088599 [Armillaria gallica]